MRHYCTLFDRNYLAKGLVLHESLRKHSSQPFTLHILAMDLETISLLIDLNLENTELLLLSNFERAMNLEPIKQSRTWQEYCWTVASCLMEYLMPWVSDVTYLDADLCFFSDPRIIFDEIDTNSIGITPHRFPTHRKHMEKNGIYNVGLVFARNNDMGRKCIAKWAQQCREWCFNKTEGDHACGDQKYLDTWPEDYRGEVCVIENPGVNLAPWNIEQYKISVGIDLEPTVNGTSVVFYHLHEFRNETFMTGYAMKPEAIDFIYKPYVSMWKAACERIGLAEAAAAERRRQLEMQAQRA